MPLRNIFLNIFANSNNTTAKQPPLIDGEIVYSKNNVCVHPPGPLSSSIKHYPGYLTLYAKVNNGETTLILNWIPNKGLEKGNHPVENKENGCITPIHITSNSEKIDSSLLKSPLIAVKAPLTKSLSNTPGRKNIKPHALPPKLVQSYETLPTESPSKANLSFNRTGNIYTLKKSRLSCSDCTLHSPNTLCNNNRRSSIECEGKEGQVFYQYSMDNNSVSAYTTCDSSEDDETPSIIWHNLSDAAGPERLESEVSDCNDNDEQLDKLDSVQAVEYNTSIEESETVTAKCTSPPAYYNMQFPENSVTFVSSHGNASISPTEHVGRVIRPAKDQVRGIFKVDLAMMRSLRLFFSNDSCSSGQLVLASRESQYKVLHFHHGGLDNLASILEDWKYSVKQRDKMLSSNNIAIHHFSICGPQLSVGQCHPEEGLYRRLSLEAWALHTNEYGQVDDEYNIRKAVFFGGMEPEIRHAVWPFLLKYYDFSSTCIDRQELRIEKRLKYEAINQARMSLGKQEKEHFWRTVACTVEKDVLRTDRGNPYYSGDNNPNLEVLRRILLNYAIFTNTGYTQGMSDLLSPILREIQNEPDVFWCFVGLMQRTIFISSPNDHDMEKQLKYLRELLRICLPDFYHHLESCGPDAMELLFAHRWILLCFKREFVQHEALMMWETCWSHYQTDYFHLFICVAIIAVYGQDVVENKLASDEMLLHFSNLAMQMNGQIVLRKARGLMHEFLIRSKIPCTLIDLSPNGVWDARYAPMIECTGEHGDEACSFGGMVEDKKKNWIKRNFFK